MGLSVVSVTLLLLAVMLSWFRNTTGQVTPSQEAYTVSLYEHEEQVSVMGGQVDCPSARVTSVTSNRLGGSPTCLMCFQVFHTGNADHYELRFLPLGSLDYRVDQNYQVTVQCVDSGNTLLKTLFFFIRIEPNTPPYFTKLYLQESRLTYQMTGSGFSLSGYCRDYDISNGDYLTFTLRSMQPRSSFFTLSSDGVIRGVGDMERECRAPITFVVDCTDRYDHRAADTLTVKLTLQDGNNAPTISGLNLAVTVAENSAGASSVGRFSVQEKNSMDTVCFLSSLNPELSQFFELQMTGLKGNILVKGNLNYEALEDPRGNLSITCSDGYCTSSAAYLYVTVSDVNEPITLLPKDFYLSHYEGLISLLSPWTPIDEDKDDTRTYTLEGNNLNSRFAVHPVTGAITATVHYDVDQNAMPSKQILVVQVEDQAGHSSSATVTLTILDSNDNAPTFSSGGAAGGQSFSATITNCTTTFGTPVGTVVATDQDSSFDGNNFISYSITEGPFTVDGQGNVIVRGSVTVGMTYVMQVTATDAGKIPNGPLTSSPPASVTVFVTECPTTPITTTTTTTTTTEPPTSTDIPESSTPTSATVNSRTESEENLGWGLIAGILALVFLITFLLMFWRFCWPVFCSREAAGRGGRGPVRCGNFCGDLCRQQPAATRVFTVEPVKGQPPKNGNAAFWQEHYTDEDYQGLPRRDGTPSPAAVENNAPLRTAPWRGRAHNF